jgi:flagellar FliL protein
MADSKAVAPAAGATAGAAAGAKGKEAAAGAKVADAGAKKKKKLPLLIAAAAVVLLVCGGGAYFLLKPSAPEAEASADGKGKPGEKDKKGEVKKPFFVEFETFTSNLKDPDKFLQVKLTFQVKTDAVAENLKELTPVVRSAVIPVLSSEDPVDLATTEGKEKFAGAIVAAVNKTLAEHGSDDTVDAALITHMLIQ